MKLATLYRSLSLAVESGYVLRQQSLFEENKVAAMALDESSDRRLQPRPSL